MAKKVMPWDEQPAKTSGSDAQKKRETKPKKDNSAQVIKWLFFSMVALLFVASIVIMAENMKNRTSEDPAEAMRRAMGISDGAEMPAAALTEIDEAINLLASENADYRLMGLTKLMELNPAKAGQTLPTYLKDVSPVVKSGAARLLGKYKVHGAHNLLMPLLMDQDPEVRAGVVEGLSAFKDEPGFMYMLRTPLMSQDPNIVLSAVEVWNVAATANIQEAQHVIVPLLSSNDERILSAALGAVSSKFTETELKSVEPYVRGIAERFRGTTVGDQAKKLIPVS